MENKKIIIVLIVIIVILTVAIGFTMFNPTHTKQPTKINITSKNTLNEGDNLTLQLTDLNKTALSKQKVNVTVKDSKGKVVLNKTVKTNSKGKAKLDLDLNKGKYNVTVSYSGNENYTGNNTTQKLTIKEEVVEAEPVSSSSGSSNNDPGAFYSLQSHKTYYTGDIVQEPGGNSYVRHLGNNRWEPI